MTWIAAAALGLPMLIAACGGGGGDPGGPTNPPAPPAPPGQPSAPSQPTSTTYAFVAPAVGTQSSYADHQLDTQNNALERTLVETVTAIQVDGSFVVHEQNQADPTLNPADTQYGAAGERVWWTIDPSRLFVQCRITQGREGPPSPLAVGGAWSTSYALLCGSGTTGSTVNYTQAGTLVAVETITVAAGTFSAYRFTSTTSSTRGGVTATDNATFWRAASGDTRLLKRMVTSSFSGGTPPQGSLLSSSRELESVR